MAKPGSVEPQQPELSPIKRALKEIRDLKSRLAEAESRAASGQGDEQNAPIAVVGMGMRFPGGIVDEASMWQLLESGGDAITDVPRERWDWRQYFNRNPEAEGAMYAVRGGFLEDVEKFDAEFFGIAPREAATLDPQQRLLHEVAWQALENAGIPADTMRNTRTGIFAGLSNFDYYRAVFKDDLRIDAYAGSGNSPSMAAGRLAYTLGTHGPALSLDTSCSSSLVAVHLAVQSLQRGECDTAIVGGVNLILAPQMHIAFSRAHMLAPDGYCKTFDAAADGYVRSEGCAVIILKRLPEAVANGDRIVAVVRGSATNHDGRSGGLTAPSPQAQTALLRAAYERAGVTVDQVGMIEAHGTGTSLGDPIELEALGAVFRHRSAELDPVYVGSVKTNLGHTEAASGMAGLLKAVLALQHRTIPPHLHVKQQTPLVTWKDLPFAIPGEKREWQLERDQHRRMAGVSSFGFSGSNAHVVLEEYVPDVAVHSDSEDVQVAVISARTPAALQAVQSQLRDYLLQSGEGALRDVCRTLTEGRMHYAHRRAWVVGTKEELLDRLREGDHADGAEASSAGQRNAAQVESPQLGESRVGFLFTGQGSEHSGMGLELLAQSAVFRSAITRMDAVLEGMADRPGSGLGKTIAEIGRNEAGELGSARYVQPALFAYEWALSELWRSWGVTPQVVLGHSLGEYVAATVAGAMTPEEGMRLVAARGWLTEQFARPSYMVAVAESEDTVRRLLAEARPGAGVSIAAVNGPASVVASGDAAAMAQLEELLRERGIRSRRLRNTHGFHSAALDGMLDAFEAEAAKIKFRIPEIPWVSNLTGMIVDRARPVDATYWRRHLRETVQFQASLQAADPGGQMLMLEVGAEPQLSALAMANGIGPERVVASSGAGRGATEWKAVLTAAAQLYTRGVDFNWKSVGSGRAFRKLPLPGYPFQRKRFWFDGNLPASMSAGSRAVKAAQEQSSMVPMGLDAARISERQEAIHRWAVAVIAVSLLQMQRVSSGREEMPVEVSTNLLINQYGVAASHRRLMDRWLKRLSDEGIVTLQGPGIYNWRHGFQMPDVDALWARAAALLQGDEPLQNYLAHCAAVIVRVLRGELDPLETLFPGGNPELAQALYERSPGSVYANRIAAAAVSAIARDGVQTAMGFARRLRVLEIGAGTGSTTAAILSTLSPRQVIYTYSDVSDVFLKRARLRFVTHPMEFVLFDLDREEHAAAHEGRYDVVIIANALHAAKNLEVSLGRVRQLLQPGGTLLLIETTSAQAWHDVSTGLIEGWQHSEEDSRIDSPLLGVDAWQQAVAKAGLEQFAAFPSADQPTQALGLHVLVAQRRRVEEGAPARMDQVRPALEVSISKNHVGRDGLDSDSLEVAAQTTARSAGRPGILEELAAASVRQRLTLVTERVRSAIAMVLGSSQSPHQDARLMELGLDSLMALELLNRLRREFALETLPSTLIFDYPTAAAIARLILQQLGYEDERPDSVAVSVAPLMMDERPAHSDEELEAMSTDEISALLRMELEAQS